MKQFLLESDPIEGMNVLEASAGTGKTFTIAGLYLRLVLEKRFDVNKILVVTFTEAATAELNQRIRDTLKIALRAFTKKLEGEAPPHFTEYPSPIPRLVETIDPSQAIERLTVNLQTFDEAAIYTIHGFCRMLLMENSFECGAQFDCELESDQASLIESVMSDYWRQTVGHASPMLIRAMNAARDAVSVEALSALVRQAMDHLDVEVIPDAPTGGRSAELLERYAAAVDDARRLWTSQGKAIEALLADSADALHQTMYAPAKVRVKAERLSLFFSMPSGSALFPEELALFTRTTLLAKVKKNGRAPEHRFFALMESVSACSNELAGALDEAVLALRRRAFEYAATHLERRKRQLGVLSFNDLLLKTRDALHSANAGMLTEKMRARFSSVLIDEFQDTDPVQYEIFSTLFADGGTILFYIGDPKQAIYGFRGADVFAYMTATAQKDVKKATLAMNFRSSKGLIHAINTIFGRALDPFVIREIEFTPVNYPPEKPDQRLVIDGRVAVPMVLMYRPYVKPGNARSGTALNKERSSDLVVSVTADEIARLLTLGAADRAWFEKGGRREALAENSIAVLVRTNKQARRMQEALSAAGVYSIVHSKQSIFVSQEAEDVLRVMEAADEPSSAVRVRCALITTLLGMTSSELDRLNRDGAGMGARHEQFTRLNAQWKRSGFVEMFTRLMEEDDVLSRVLALPDGERRAANVLQLVELLQNAESEGHLAPSALVQWLEAKITGEEQEAEEYVENLSTDKKAVNIVTVHGSKGLQYKIVFCPFLWELPTPRTNDLPVFFHETTVRTGGKHQLIFDIGSEEKASHERIASEENLAELMRLAYVAMTRAEYRCYLLYGNFASAGQSAAVYLLHGDAYGEGIEHVLADEQAVFARLEMLERESGGVIESIRMPDPVDRVVSKPADDARTRVELQARARTRVIAMSGTIASYTSLAQHATGPVQAMAYRDEPEETTAAAPAGAPDATDSSARSSGILSFARGRLAGDFFHEVFEKVDFDLANVRELVASKMQKYDLDASGEAAAIEAVQTVLDKELPAVAPGFTLSRLERTHRRHEIDFYFPAAPFARHRLRRFMNEYMKREDGPSGVGDVADATVRGWLNGKIDMLFEHGGKYFIVDWKSNYLGHVREAYAQEHLRDAMVRNDYFLQALLYTLAADRYLRDRLPAYDYKRDFGGVFYLFLRGIDAGSNDDYGIFFERPDAKSVAGLARLIAEPMPKRAESEMARRERSARTIDLKGGR